MARHYERQNATDEVAQTNEIFQRVYMASQKLQGSSANVVHVTNTEYAQFRDTAVAWALQEANDRNWIPPQIVLVDDVQPVRRTKHTIPRSVKIGAGIGAGIIIGSAIFDPIVVPKLFPDHSHAVQKPGPQMSNSSDPNAFNTYSDDCFNTGWYHDSKAVSKQTVSETDNGTVILKHSVTSFAVLQAGEQVIIPVGIHVDRVEVCGASSTLKVDGSASSVYVGPNVQLDIVNGSVTDAYLDGPNKCPAAAALGHIARVHTDC